VQTTNGLFRLFPTDGELIMKKTIRNIIIAFVMAAAGSNLFAAKAYMLMANGPLYEEKNGKMAQAMKLSTGTSIETTGGAEKDGMVQVTYQDKQLWVYKSQISSDPNGAMAIVVEDATVFDGLDLVNCGKSVLKTGALVLSCGPAKSDFATLTKIQYYNYSLKSVTNGYILENKSSTDKSMRQAMTVFAKIKKAKTKKAQEASFNNLKKLQAKSSADISSIVKAADEYLHGVDLEEGGFYDFSSPLKMVIFADYESTINMRSKPGTSADNSVTGKITGTREADNYNILIAQKRTKHMQTINGITDYWYYGNVENEDKSGWIFGAYLHFYDF